MDTGETGGYRRAWPRDGTPDRPRAEDGETWAGRNGAGKTGVVPWDTSHCASEGEDGDNGD